jgi:HTH-type transcriptional regulator/antitoxin HigA
MAVEKHVGIEPPGFFIKLELEARGWSQRDLAFVLGQVEQQLTPLLSGKRTITPDMARLLADAFDTSPEFFLNLQSHFDLANAKEPDPAVKARAQLQSAFPIREMVRRGWIKDGEASLLRLQMSRFLEEANDNDSKSSIAFAAKRTHYDDTPPHQLAWVHRVRQLAKKLPVESYSPERLIEALPKLKSFMIDPDAIKEVPGILAECGVRLIVVEALPNAKIDGVCTWLDDGSPVIGLSTLYDRIDNFWFVLRHEIEHVLLGHGKGDLGMVDLSLTADMNEEPKYQSEEERLANEAAADFCVPVDKFNSFFARKSPYFYEKDVIGFASVLGVHPGIVVGQLQRRMKRYDYLRKYQVPVRQYLTETALADGWGTVAPAEL